MAADRSGTYLGGSASAYFSDMLGDRFLGVGIQAYGTFKDIGAQAFYLDQTERLNWGVAAGRTPYAYAYYGFETTAGGTLLVVRQVRERISIDAGLGLVRYPLSWTRRLEGSVGVTRYSFDRELEEYITDWYGQVIAHRKGHLPVPDPLTLVHGSLTMVGDRSFFGFSSPVRGARYRFEIEATTGTADFLAPLLDYRRYFNPAPFVTVAVRGLHYGRYGDMARLDSLGFQPLFLGYETLVRGYAYESFTSDECSQTAESSCGEFSRLFGRRLAVANLEVRVPLTGTNRFGLLDFPSLPIELAAFADAGLAWDSERRARIAFSTSSADRIPVFSAGVSARLSLFGALVLEVYRAYPWQRPVRGWHWGFQIAPGW